MARQKRTREQKAIAKGKPYGIASERRQLNCRSTSSRIYENGKLSMEIKRQLQDEPPHYRFVGVKTEKHWSIADIPAVWPEIECLHTAKSELEVAQLAGVETKMKRGHVKHKRRVLEAIASWIDGQAMKSVVA
jgi:hypothetical protein